MPTNKQIKTLPVTVGQPASAADAALSAAFRQALGGKAGEPHLPASPLKRGQEIARLAKTDNPGASLKGSPRKAHIGPRSGHK